MGFLRYQSLAPAYDDGSLQKDVDYESYKKLGDASDRNQFIRDMEIVKQGLGLKGKYTNTVSYSDTTMTNYHGCLPFMGITLKLRANLVCSSNLKRCGDEWILLSLFLKSGFIKVENFIG